MFTSSVRRVAFTAPPSPTVLAFKTSAPRVISCQYRSHQRRPSSSKSSSPSNGPKGVADGQTAPSQSGRPSRRKAKEVAGDCTVKPQDQSAQNLPSVPSTTHLKDRDISTSSFFSLHRPISVTDSWPTNVSEDAFGTIFMKKPKRPNTSQVINTLSNTVGALETALSRQRSGGEFSIDTRNIAKNSDAQATALTVPLAFPQHILPSNFMPFNPPPPPMPLSEEQSAAAGLEASEDISRPAHSKTYYAIITVEESKDENGKMQYVGYASSFVPEQEEPPRLSFLERMRIRQRRYEEYRDQKVEENRIWAISVKRQRKLKMKKHKYKKLMRRTRNLRRRLDRN